MFPEETIVADCVTEFRKEPCLVDISSIERDSPASGVVTDVGPERASKSTNGLQQDCKRRLNDECRRLRWRAVFGGVLVEAVKSARG